MKRGPKSSVQHTLNSNPNINRAINNIQKYLDPSSLSKSNISVYNIFNKLISELGNFNEKEIMRGSFANRLSQAKSYEQAFLSHAYDDRLYTAALFEYFFQRGTFLYIDWMHHDKYKDGKELKRDLQEELSRSNQLMFLRTPNSELNIQGKQFIRPWCSWEMGSFYSLKGGEEKYLLNLYSVDKYRNLQLHGLKLFDGIEFGKMVGSEIKL